MPGTPSSASISKPESSARANIPEALAYARAFNCAFSAKVVPVSSTSMSNCTSRKERSRKGMSEKMEWYSSSLCILVVANNKSRILSLYRGKLLCKEKLQCITNIPTYKASASQSGYTDLYSKTLCWHVYYHNFSHVVEIKAQNGVSIATFRPDYT